MKGKKTCSGNAEPEVHIILAAVLQKADKHCWV